MNDDELQEDLAFESRCHLFRFFLDPIPGTSINQPTAFDVPVDPTDKCLKRSLQRLSPDKQGAKNGINVDPTSYKKDCSLNRDSTSSDSNSSTDGSDENEEEEINDGDIVDFISEPQNDMFRQFL